MTPLELALMLHDSIEIKEKQPQHQLATQNVFDLIQVVDDPFIGEPLRTRALSFDALCRNTYGKYGEQGYMYFRIGLYLKLVQSSVDFYVCMKDDHQEIIMSSNVILREHLALDDQQRLTFADDGTRSMIGRGWLTLPLPPMFIFNELTKTASFADYMPPTKTAKGDYKRNAQRKFFAKVLRGRININGTKIPSTIIPPVHVGVSEDEAALKQLVESHTIDTFANNLRFQSQFITLMKKCNRANIEMQVIPEVESAVDKRKRQYIISRLDLELKNHGTMLGILGDETYGRARRKASQFKPELAHMSTADFTAHVKAGRMTINGDVINAGDEPHQETIDFIRRQNNKYHQRTKALRLQQREILGGRMHVDGKPVLHGQIHRGYSPEEHERIYNEHVGYYKNSQRRKGRTSAAKANIERYFINMTVVEFTKKLLNGEIDYRGLPIVGHISDPHDKQATDILIADVKHERAQINKRYQEGKLKT